MSQSTLSTWVGLMLLGGLAFTLGSYALDAVRACRRRKRGGPR